MKKKLNGEAGFTLMEMLAATIILILLTLMLSTGLQMTVRNYQKIVALSEVDLLMSTAMDALADELRFAQRVNGSYGIPNDFTYVSNFFNKKEIRLDVDSNGQIVAMEIGGTSAGKRLLSTADYGAGEIGEERAYRVMEMNITPRPDNTFEIFLKVQATADESIEASRTVTVRCLNKMN